MENLTVGEFKANFSEMIEKVKKGQRIGVLFGKSRKPVGMFVPFEDDQVLKKRTIGILEGKATYEWAEEEMTEEELIENADEIFD
jgi:antitoxin (DNA-binding transcriptional repressor) of toxin-antitoxin stability system